MPRVMKRRLPSTQGEALRFFLLSPGPVLGLAIFLVCLVARHELGDWQWWEGVVSLLLISTRGVFEWLSHTYLFHERPLPYTRLRIRSPIGVMHRRHHLHPDEASSVLFGGPAVVAAAATIAALSFLVTGSPAVTLVLVFNGALLLLLYDYFHLLAHSHVQPQWKWMRKIVDNHRDHHQHPRLDNMGVSSTLGDWLFRQLHTRKRNAPD